MNGDILTKKNFLRSFYNLEDINLEAIEDLSSLVLESEKRYTDQINEIVQKITEKKSKTKIVLISGPSAAGKTTTSNLLTLYLGMKNRNSIVISLDNFFLNRCDTKILEDGSYDYESINALDLNYLNQFIINLIEKKSAKMPIFNFVTGEREKNFTDVSISDKTIVIIEGLHALNPQLIKTHQDELYKIYIALNSDFAFNDEVLLTAKQLRLLRRITRDFFTRGYSALETVDMWQNVLQGEDRYIKPFKNTSDFIIDSIHKYEPLLYAKYTKKILKDGIAYCGNKKIVHDRIELENILKNLLEKLSFCEPVSKNLVPSTSLIWEFIGNA